MKHSIFCLIFILCTFGYLFSEGEVKDATGDSEEPVSALDEFLDTLEYGIEEEVVGLLKDLPLTLNETFYRLLQERYSEAQIPDTKVKIAGFLANCENMPAGFIDLLYEDAQNDETDKTLRKKLFLTLSKQGGLREGELLIQMLDNTDTALLLEASTVFKNIKDPAIVPKLINRLKASDVSDDKYLPDNVKSNLILAFGEMEAKEAAPYLREVVKDSANDKYVIMYSMYSLAKIQDDSSIDLIRENLSSDEVGIVEYAAYALSTFKNQTVIPILHSMLKHNNKNVRIYACQGIVLNGDTGSIGILQYKYRKDPEKTVRYEALKSLVTLGSAGIDGARELHKKKKFGIYALSAIAEAVSKSPDEGNVLFLLDLYTKSEKQAKEAIARIIVRSKSNRVDPIIKALLQSPDYLIRIGGIKAVYTIEDSTLWPEVKSIADSDPLETVRKNAKRFIELNAIK